MKKYKILLGICVLGVIIIYAFLFLGKPELVTQKLDNLEKVRIVFQANGTEKKRIVSITERSEMEHVYMMLKETTKFNVNKYPRHAESVQWDSKFAIYLEYENGRKDKFFATERNGGIFRFLNTMGSSGDMGYISGSNKKLWDYVFNLSY